MNLFALTEDLGQWGSRVHGIFESVEDAVKAIPSLEDGVRTYDLSIDEFPIGCLLKNDSNLALGGVVARYNTKGVCYERTSQDNDSLGLS